MSHAGGRGSDPVYLSHFGLAERPFAITPDPRFLYLSERHREALAHLLYGMGEHGGFVQLTGEVGTGKTTLWRYALERLPPEVDVAVVLNSRLTATELLATLCDELRITYPPEGRASVKTLVDALYAHLLEAHGRGRRTVLIIDEAQNLGVDALEQVRMLTNLETPREKLLQIILIGQPELARLLGQSSLRQVAQRITARYHLLPFTEQETRAYVLYRMQVAGQGDPVFDPGALRAVHRLSRGIPRLINVVCDRALLGAYATRRATVSASIVRRAAAEVFSSPIDGRIRARSRRLAVAVGLGAGVVTTVALLFALPAGRLAPPLDRARHQLLPSSQGPASMPATAEAEARQARPVAPGVGTGAAGPASRAPRSATGVAVSSRPELADLLAGASRSGQAGAAYARLYALWGVTSTTIDPAAPCAAAPAAGLACLTNRGTWKVLRRLDVPAAIELTTTTGEGGPALVTALDDAQAVLEIGGARRAVPLAEVDRLWDGRFTVVWKAPPVDWSPVPPATRGPAVVWLRRRLSRIDHLALPPAPSDIYDDDLRRRVTDFQRGQSLVPDGIVGDETWLRLTAVLDPAAPSLSAPRPRP